MATTTIPANPGRVCDVHATEYWTGLLTCAHDRSTPNRDLVTPRPPRSCDDSSAPKARTIAAVDDAEPSPRNAERAPLRLVS